MVTPTRATIEAVLPLSVQDKRYDLGIPDDAW